MTISNIMIIIQKYHMLELHNGSSRIVDKCFLQSLKKLDQDSKTHLAYLMFRSLCLIVIVPININILNNEQLSGNMFSIYLSIALAYNLIETFQCLYFYFGKIRNKKVILNIAITQNHCLQLEEIKEKLNEDYAEQMMFYEMNGQYHLKVSSVFYDFQNMEKQNDVPQENQQIRQKINMNNIRNSLQIQTCCYKISTYILSLISISMFVYGIVLSFINPISESQHSLLEFFLLSEIIFKPKLYVILVFILLIPFLLLFWCIYVCFCKRQKKAKLPPSIEATAHNISKCSQCAICFMSYSVGDTIVILPCSEMHIYHQTCISAWTKINPICPTCRFSLAE